MSLFSKTVSTAYWLVGWKHAEAVQLEKKLLQKGTADDEISAMQDSVKALKKADPEAFREAVEKGTGRFIQLLEAAAEHKPDMEVESKFTLYQSRQVKMVGPNPVEVSYTAQNERVEEPIIFVSEIPAFYVALMKEYPKVFQMFPLTNVVDARKIFANSGIILPAKAVVDGFCNVCRKELMEADVEYRNQKRIDWLVGKSIENLTKWSEGNKLPGKSSHGQVSSEAVERFSVAVETLTDTNSKQQDTIHAATDTANKQQEHISKVTHEKEESDKKYEAEKSHSHECHLILARAGLEIPGRDPPKVAQAQEGLPEVVQVQERVVTPARATSTGGRARNTPTPEVVQVQEERVVTPARATRTGGRARNTPTPARAARNAPTPARAARNASTKARAARNTSTPARGAATGARPTRSSTRKKKTLTPVESKFYDNEGVYVKDSYPAGKYHGKEGKVCYRLSTESEVCIKFDDGSEKKIHVDHVASENW